MDQVITGKRSQSSLHPVTVCDPSKIYNGYTLYAPLGQTDVWLVDMAGQFVHHWKLPGEIRVMAELLPNGNLLCCDITGKEAVPEIAGSAGEIIEVDWDGKLVWKYEDPYINSHDWCRMENGNTMISHFVPIPDHIAAKVKGGVPGSEFNGVMWSDCFQEITPDGKVVWEWLVYEHIDFDLDFLCPLCSRQIWPLINSLSVLSDGNILTSFRNVDTIAIIDRSTGDLKWRWGRGELGHQHNPIMVGNGNVLVFDNGLHRRDYKVDINYSRVLEVNPNTDKIVWEYKDDNSTKLFSCVCAGVQRLPNGNTQICEATKGRIFEVTPGKEIVWEFTNPFYGFYHRGYIGWTNMMYRAHRYGLDYEGLKGKDLDPHKFEWLLQEQGAPETEKKGRAINDRLTKLGY